MLTAQKCSQNRTTSLKGKLLKQDTIFQEQYKINQNVALLEHA